MLHTKVLALPKRIEVSDYHEFRAIEDAYKLLELGIKVKEIEAMGDYVGIIYTGSLEDAENAEMIKAIKEESVKFWKERK